MTIPLRPSWRCGRIKTVKKPEKEKRLVVAVISADNASGRAQLRGVRDAARRFGWRLETIDIYFQGDDWPRINRELLEHADGVVARHFDSVSGGTLAALGVPLVGTDTGGAPSNPGTRNGHRDFGLWAEVSCDAAAVSNAAAQELLATGLEHFVFVAPPKRLTWTKNREREFARCIREAGRDIRRYRPTTEWDWAAERKSLVRWLSRQPRPFGLFAANDQFSKFALEACLEAGLEVPRDVAVIGADDDDTYCLAVKPSLTSVRIDFEGAGRLAAETLQRLMDGDEPQLGRHASSVSWTRKMCLLPAKGATHAPRKPLRLQYGVLGVARRGSTRTGTASSTDPRLQDGLDFIARRFGDPYIGVRNVAEAMGVKMRQAYRLFDSTGKTIRQHIEETRLARIRELLSASDKSISDIVKECGFTSQTYFCDFCRRRLGCSPTAWRARSRRAATVR